eukprot:5943353-Pleurochrysis_carterae.AAC.1
MNDRRIALRPRPASPPALLLASVCFFVPLVAFAFLSSSWLRACCLAPPVAFSLSNTLRPLSVCAACPTPIDLQAYPAPRFALQEALRAQLHRQCEQLVELCLRPPPPPPPPLQRSAKAVKAAEATAATTAAGVTTTATG